MTARLRRAIATFSLLAAAGSALAHPGHDAPTLHAHDLGEALVVAAVIVLIGLARSAIAAAVRARARARER